MSELHKILNQFNILESIQLSPVLHCNLLQTASLSNYYKYCVHLSLWFLKNIQKHDINYCNFRKIWIQYRYQISECNSHYRLTKMSFTKKLKTRIDCKSLTQFRIIMINFIFKIFCEIDSRPLKINLRRSWNSCGPSLILKDIQYRIVEVLISLKN